MPKPTDRTQHDGKTVDWLTHCVLLEMEIRLGYRLTIVQGSFNKGVGASAGTHDGSGCVDLSAYDWQNKVRVGRAVGLAIWHRTSSQGPWNAHCHGVTIGAAGLAPVAARQVTAYFNGRNGLASNARDNFARPNPIPTYVWPGSDAALALEKKTADFLDKKGAKPPVTPSPAPAPPKVAPGALRIDGVDLSHWNTVTAAGLTAARLAGCRWAYHKATEGTGYVDPTFTKRRTLIKASGLTFSGYHFARPASSSGLAQAAHFLAVAKPVTGEMRPMLDLEDQGGLSRAKLTAWVGAFVAEVKRVTGEPCFIYTPFDLDSTFDCPLWTARYHPANAHPNIPAPWKQYTVHQFSNGQIGKPSTVAGLGKVDLNTMAGDPAQLTRKFTLGSTAAPAPLPLKEPADMPLSDADLTKIRAIVSEEVERRVGDVVPIPANLAGVWSAKNEKLTVASAVSYLLSKVDPAVKETPPK